MYTLVELKKTFFYHLLLNLDPSITTLFFLIPYCDISIDPCMVAIIEFLQ